MLSSLRELAFSKIDNFTFKNISVFNLNDTVSKVLGVLKETERYEAVVLHDTSAGLVTIRDILDVNQPSRTKLESVWRRTGTVRSSDDIISTTEKMIRDNIRAIPVVKGRTIVGIISQMEIISAMCDFKNLSTLRVKDFIRSPVVSLDIDEKLSLARRIMLDKGISHIPVVEYNRLVGVVTAKDLVHTFIIPTSRTTHGERVEEKIPSFPGLVNSFMDTQPFTVKSDASVLDAVCGLKEYGKSACFMVDSFRSILGILTPKELMIPLLSVRREEELPVYIIGLAEEDFFERAVAEEKIRRVISLSKKFHPGISEVSVKIKRSQTHGNRTRYELSARVMISEGQLNAKAEGWDLLEVFNQLCNIIGKSLRKTKPETSIRQRKRRGRK